MRPLRIMFGWLLALALVVWRSTCRYRIPTHDPRPALRAREQCYVYALLHAHQVAAVFVNDERDLCAMVSRSGDGDLLVPSLRCRRVSAVRGSSRKRGADKGGRRALAELADVVSGGVPGLIAVDGPRGPRNEVRRGIGDLAVQIGAVVLPVVVVSSRRWVFARSWDRFQLPKPFSRVDLCFGTPIDPQGQTSESIRSEVSETLVRLEEMYDPEEAAFYRPPADRVAVRTERGT